MARQHPAPGWDTAFKIAAIASLVVMALTTERLRERRRTLHVGYHEGSPAIWVERPARPLGRPRRSLKKRTEVLVHDIDRQASWYHDRTPQEDFDEVNKLKKEDPELDAVGWLNERSTQREETEKRELRERVQGIEAEWQRRGAIDALTEFPEKPRNVFIGSGDGPPLKLAKERLERLAGMHGGNP